MPGQGSILVSKKRERGRHFDLDKAVANMMDIPRIKDSLGQFLRTRIRVIIASAVAAFFTACRIPADQVGDKVTIYPPCGAVFVIKVSSTNKYHTKNRIRSEIKKNKFNLP